MSDANWHGFLSERANQMFVSAPLLEML